MTNLTTVLFAENLAVRHAISYLYSVVLKARFDAPIRFLQSECLIGRSSKVDLAIVHVPQTGNAGMQLVRELSHLDDGPAIIALVSAESSMVCDALLSGADDVMVWPGCLHELALRSCLRLGLPLDDPILQGGEKNWELGAFVAEKAGLSTVEAQIVGILLRRLGEIVSRDDLSFALDERPWRYGDRKFDVHIAKIRKKLADKIGPDLSVETIRSEGYQFLAKGTDFAGGTLPSRELR